MKIQNYFLSILLLTTFSCYAQVNFNFSNAMLINNEEVNNPRNLCTADIDNDGDMDVISASIGDNKIAWYENTNGLGEFGIQQLIDNNTSGATAVYATDIDTDGYTDVVMASSYDNTIAWYRNENGNGTFSEKKMISNQCNFASSVSAADIDNDGDIDVISSSLASDEIVWYENTDGAGSFSNSHLVSNTADGAIFVSYAHINQDEHIDIISASLMGNTIAWYENIDGNGNFGEAQIISDSLDQARSVFACDIDNDGFTDVLSASSADESIAWYKNTDGNGHFGYKQLIDNSMKGVTSVVCTDIDGDGDADVIANAYNTNKIACYNNTNGQGDFAPAHYISETAGGVNGLHIADLNGDNVMDVLAACEVSNMLIWFQNETEQDYIAENHKNNLNIYPNPADQSISLDNTKLEIQSFTISDIHGTKLMNIKPSAVTTQIDISHLPSGVYCIGGQGKAQIFKSKFIKL